jgi:methylated-DNA-protein-cysteine methyltransferase-like protein
MVSSPPEIDKAHRIWQVVAAIPPGKVASYGQVAALAGLGRGARQVGRALRELPGDSRLPWHRVINARGRISLPTGSRGHREQRERLLAEGVVVQEGGRIDLARYGWRP